MASTSTRYVPNRKFAKQAMNSPEMIAETTAKAEEICTTANSMYGASGYRVSPGRKGKVSAHALVYTGDRYAMRSNALHNTLQKSIR